MNKLFGAPSIPKTAVQTTAPAIPASDDEELRKARIKQAAEERARSGRASTFLSGAGETLGS